MWFIKIRNFMNAVFMSSQLWYTKTWQLLMSSGFLCKATRLLPNPSCLSRNSYLSALYQSTASHYMSRHTLLLHRLLDRAVCCVLLNSSCGYCFSLSATWTASHFPDKCIWIPKLWNDIDNDPQITLVLFVDYLGQWLLKCGGIQFKKGKWQFLDELFKVVVFMFVSHMSGGLKGQVPNWKALY